MNCDNDIHLYLKDEYISCPFCEQIITNSNENDIKYTCCDNQDIIYNNCFVCRHCGFFYGYGYVNEFIDFHTTKYRINKKSIYHRKYYLFNKIDNLVYNKSCEVSYNNKNKIIQIFLVLEEILPTINKNRKRLININFLFKKIFKLLNINIDIEISKAQKL